VTRFPEDEVAKLDERVYDPHRFRHLSDGDGLNRVPAAVRSAVLLTWAAEAYALPGEHHQVHVQSASQLAIGRILLEIQEELATTRTQVHSGLTDLAAAVRELTGTVAMTGRSARELTREQTHAMSKALASGLSELNSTLDSRLVTVADELTELTGEMCTEIAESSAMRRRSWWSWLRVGRRRSELRGSDRPAFEVETEVEVGP
jgi:hypothetical protein